MRKILLPAIVALALGTNLNAANPNINYDAEFAKMNQLFNSLMNENFNAVKLKNFSYPRTDMQDLKNKCVLKFDLAGVPKENIKLSISDSKVLTIEGKKEQQSEDKSKTYVKKEIFYGSFKKVMQLPSDIDQNKLTTSYKNGILTLEIGKTKKPKAKLIPIR